MKIIVDEKTINPTTVWYHFKKYLPIGSLEYIIRIDIKNDIDLIKKLEETHNFNIERENKVDQLKKFNQSHNNLIDTIITFCKQSGN